MITAEKLHKVKQASAAKTHGVRTGGDGYGANARQGGSVVRVPEPIVRRDAMFTSRRMRDLAKLIGEYDGFVVPLHDTPDTATGYAVSVHPEREDKRRGFLSGPYLAEYIVRNLDLLSHPSAVLSVRRDRATGHTYLNVCTVVAELETARLLSQVHQGDTLVRMADGRLCRV